MSSRGVPGRGLVASRLETTGIEADGRAGHGGTAQIEKRQSGGLTRSCLCRAQHGRRGRSRDGEHLQRQSVRPGLLHRGVQVTKVRVWSVNRARALCREDRERSRVVRRRSILKRDRHHRSGRPAGKGPGPASAGGAPRRRLPSPEKRVLRTSPWRRCSWAAGAFQVGRSGSWGSAATNPRRAWNGGTAVVPDASSYASRAFGAVYRTDAPDAGGRIDTP